MRIALVAPLAEAVPPKLYGGTERVVSWLAEELGKQGHRVALFASAESETAAELVVCAPQSLRLAGIRDHLGSTLAMLREVRRRADDFDIIHFHVDLLPQALFHDLAHKCLVTASALEAAERDRRTRACRNRGPGSKPRANECRCVLS